MKKLILMILSVLLICLMSGCDTNNSIKEQTIALVTPTCTPAPQKEPGKVKEKLGEISDESKGEDKPSLQLGLEVWEKTEAVIALNCVLAMEAPVREVVIKEDNTTSKDFRQYYLNEINRFMDVDFDQMLTPDRYAIVDLDHDASPEVIITLSVGYDSFILLLRYYEGSVYGYPYELRGFEYPKTDGTFFASSGALDNQIMELSFEGLTLKERCLGYSMSDLGSVEYFIANKEASETEFSELSEKFYSKEDVQWYLFPSRYRAGYTGEKLLRVDFDAITQPVVKTLESYYSDQEGQTVFTHSSRIPQSLCDLIIEAMKSGTEEEAFAPFKTGEEISQEEFCNLTGLIIGDWLPQADNPVEQTGSVTPVRIDADNDGSQDLFGLCYWGGSGGFSSMQLYRSSEGVKYQLSSSAESMYQEYKFLSYQGKNYLLMKNFDYNTKYHSGYTLYLYEEGVLAEGISFSYAIEDYEIKITYENAAYDGREQIKNTLCNKDLANILSNNDGVIVGTAETIEETDNTDYRYSCDIDNDGKTEHYNKYLWYPSNMGTVMECFYDFEASEVLEDLCARLDDEVGEGRLYTFWIDRIGDNNVMYLYYGRNLDYSLYAYLLQGTVK